MLVFGIQFPTDRSDDPLLIKCVRELDINDKLQSLSYSALLQRGRFCKKLEEQVLLLASSKANSGSMRTRLNKHRVPCSLFFSSLLVSLDRSEVEVKTAIGSR